MLEERNEELFNSRCNNYRQVIKICKHILLNSKIETIATLNLNISLKTSQTNLFTSHAFRIFNACSNSALFCCTLV